MSLIEPAPTKPDIEFGWYSLLIIFLVCQVALNAVIGLQSINKYSQKAWSKPSWLLNPFNLGDPLQFFHLAGFSMLAIGFTKIIRSFIYGLNIPVVALVPVSTGLGILCGVAIAQWVFRSKYQEGE